MRSEPKRISPLSSSQKPAIMRKSVVLPQPEGPSRVKNSPSPTVRSTSSTARTVPKLRLTPEMTIPATQRESWRTSLICSRVLVRFSVQPSSS